MFEEILSVKKKSKAVVLLSGGMDSTSLLYYCNKIHENNVHAVIIDYNQRHIKEVEHAKRISYSLQIPFTFIHVQLPVYEGSPLSDLNTPVPRQSDDKQAVTVVPLRNTFFLLHACAVATSLKAEDVYLGAVEDDQLSYPDCRPEFFESFQSMLRAQNNNITINYPFVKLKKEKIVALGEQLHVPWDLTWTCYKGQDKACGECDACKERIIAFQANNIADPIQYE